MNDSRVVINSEHTINESEYYKLIAKWYKAIIEYSGMGDTVKVEIMRDNDYVRIYRPFSHDKTVLITWEWIPDTHHLYLQHTSWEYLRSQLIKRHSNAYDYISWDILGYLFNHDIHANKFGSLSAALLYIQLVEKAINQDLSE